MNLLYITYPPLHVKRAAFARIKNPLLPPLSLGSHAHSSLAACYVDLVDAVYVSAFVAPPVVYVSTSKFGDTMAQPATKKAAAKRGSMRK